MFSSIKAPSDASKWGAKLPKCKINPSNGKQIHSRFFVVKSKLIKISTFYILDTSVLPGFKWLLVYYSLSMNQTAADKDSESPDSSCLSLSGRTDRQRTEFFFKSGHRTESRQTESGQTESGQTDIGQDFLQNYRQNSDSGQNRDRQNPDIQTPDRIFRKIRTKTKHGQDTDSAVRRRLL